ncbi:hypothetical protein BDW74DRAFT_184211 [Aspergillus multicolor]|uniref:uncharacterized protein n=1 Tax=Aspergillus multicolor TaxID=41759 RepID=UPI003CCD1235
MTGVTFLLALVLSIDLTSAAHAGFHIQFPRMTRGPGKTAQLPTERYKPLCGEILHNPEIYTRRSRSFPSFSGHPGDLMTALYTRQRVPINRDGFPFTILQDVRIQPSGQLCVNVTIPFQTTVDEIGVMYFEAKDPRTGNVVHHCCDVKMVDIVTLPEDHPAMCATNNETLTPMPDEFL